MTTGSLSGSVSLKNLLHELSLPCDVPEDVEAKSDSVATTREAIGFLHGVQDRIVQQIRDDADRRASKVATVIEQKIEELTKKAAGEASVPKKSAVLQLLSNPACIGAPILYVLSPLLLVIEGVCDGIRAAFEPIEQQTSLKLSEKPEFVALLKKVGSRVGVAIPEEISATNAKPLFEAVKRKVKETKGDARALKEMVQAAFFLEMAKMVPEEMLAQAERNLQRPEIRDEIAKLGIPVPSSLNAENLAQLLCEMEKKKTNEEAFEKLMAIVEPCFAALTREVEAGLPEASDKERAPSSSR